MSKLNHGDFRRFVTADMWKQLQRVVNEKSGRARPYYVLVVVKPYYQGPPAASRFEKGVAVAPQTKEQIIGGNVCHARLILMERPPIVPQLGTLLFKVSNHMGSMKLIYALPFDKPNPTEDSDNAGDVATLAAQSAQNLQVPLVFN